MRGGASPALGRRLSKGETGDSERGRSPGTTPVREAAVKGWGVAGVLVAPTPGLF